MIIVEALFILTCFRGVIVDGLGNGSMPRANNSELQLNVSVKVTAIPTVGKENKTELPANVNNSTNTSANVNNASSLHTSSNTSVGKEEAGPNEFPDAAFPYLNESLYKRNEPFFSKEFNIRLKIWRKTLINASRQCIKFNNNSKTDIVGNLEIDFPVLGVKENIEGAFLSFETLRPVLVRRNKAHDLVSIAYMSILELWPLMVLCFSCAALSGIVVWLLVSRE